MLAKHFSAAAVRMLAATAFLAAAVVPVPAEDMTHHDDMAVMAGDLEITAAWARAMLPNQPAGGGYLTITNNGAEPDRLVGASSPAAGKVEIHSMEVVDDVMTMRPVEGGQEIAPGESVELKPGGLHLMFMQVSEPFRVDDTVTVTLEFATAGTVDVDLPVRDQGKDGHGNHDH